jgi:hypothetical protein
MFEFDPNVMAEPQLRADNIPNPVGGIARTIYQTSKRVMTFESQAEQQIKQITIKTRLDRERRLERLRRSTQPPQKSSTSS